MAKALMYMAAGLLLGAVLGGILSLGAAGGAIGAAQTGICLAAEAGKAQSVLSAAEADQIVKAAIADIKRRTDPRGHDSIDWIDSDAECVEKLAELRQMATPEGG